jgi:hypothetical protein
LISDDPSADFELNEEEGEFEMEEEEGEFEMNESDDEEIPEDVKA